MTPNANRKNAAIPPKIPPKSSRFTPATNYRPADWGHHFYAPQSFAVPNGRRIMFGWMGEFARALASQDDGWAGQLTVPREFSLNDDFSLLHPLPRDLCPVRSSRHRHLHVAGQ